MFKSKLNKTILVIALVLVLAGCALGAYVGGRVWTNRLPLEHDYDLVYGMGNYSLEADEYGEFKVLKINDTHLINGICKEDARTLSGIKEVLDRQYFDLIILNGDVIDGFSFNPKYDKENAIKEMATLIEAYSTPWTLIPGNNDGEMDGDDRDVIAYMLRYEHFLAGNVKGIYGDMQFSIEVTSGGSLAHLITIMDTGMRNPAVTGSYDHLRENQVEKLLEVVREKKVLTSLFFHMQTPAFESAFNEGEHLENMPKRYSQAYDTIPKNATFDKMIEEESLIKLISVGHQHGNSMCALYNDRYYELASPSGYNAWRPEGVNPSVTAITINVGESAVESLYHFEKIEI